MSKDQKIKSPKKKMEGINQQRKKEKGKKYLLKINIEDPISFGENK